VFVKQTHNKKTGRTNLSIVQGYHDKERGHSRTKTIENLGYLDELQKIYEDPKAHFDRVCQERNRQAKMEAAEYTIVARKDSVLPENSANRRNYGYIVILRILAELGLDRFFVNRRQRTKIEFNTQAIMRLLVVSRILSPGSKQKAYNEKKRYFDFERGDMFKQEDVYRALSHFATLDGDIQRLIHDRISKRYGRKTGIIYYDVTNYYFEIEKEDELRKKGVSKEHRPDPIVQMGMALDEEGLPISYEVFEGNESEKLHLRPMVSELVRNYDVGKVITVADAAQNTGNNIYYIEKAGQKYVFSQSIRGGGKAFKKYVLDEKGYEWFGEEYKRKSQAEMRDIQVSFMKDGKERKKTVSVEQRQIVFYSKKYAERSRYKREIALKKAKSIISNPGAYTRATAYGALKYIKNLVVDKETGELKAVEGVPCFDLDRVREEEEFDGYYAIVTNVYDEGENKGKFGDDAIIDIYHGLWRIEDSFRVTKSDLETRPVYLSREDRIRAHFLTCFISLVVLRLIEKKTGNVYSPAKLVEAMNNISCSSEGSNLFLFDYRDEVADALGRAFGIDFTKERLTRAEIKKNIGDAKKV